jgi:hypothetical protein
MSAGVTTDADSADDHIPPVARAEATAQAVIGHIKHGVLAVFHAIRGLLFVVYLVLGVASFWLWLLTLIVGFFLVVIRGVMLVLLWLSGGMPPRQPSETIAGAVRRDLDRLWAQRLVAYEAFARPAARHFLRLQRAAITFWHWHLLRKIAAAWFIVAFIGVPALYMIPRPHYVQVTDDNAIHYKNEGGRVKYLVHGLDLYDSSTHREYLNEDMWWLGKINSQGLKSQLQVGKYYRLWVVGIRWYYMPQLFPNIISATEVDAEGHTLEHPSRPGVPAKAEAK